MTVTDKRSFNELRESTDSLDQIGLNFEPSEAPNEAIPSVTESKKLRSSSAASQASHVDTATIAPITRRMRAPLDNKSFDFSRLELLANGPRDVVSTHFDPLNIRTFESFTYRAFLIYSDFMVKYREATMLPSKRPDIFRDLASEPAVKGVNYKLRLHYLCWKLEPATYSEYLLGRMLILADERLLAYTRLFAFKDASRDAFWAPGMHGYLYMLEMCVKQAAQHLSKLLEPEECSEMFFKSYYESHGRFLSICASHLQQSEEGLSQEAFQQSIIIDLGKRCRALDSMIDAELHERGATSESSALSPLPGIIRELLNTSSTSPGSSRVCDSDSERLSAHIEQFGAAVPELSAEELARLAVMLLRDVEFLYRQAVREVADYWRVHSYKLPPDHPWRHYF